MALTMTAFDEFLKYLRTLDRDVPTRMRSASEADIRRLGSLTQHSLPVIYRDYLASCGENDGGLDLFFGRKSDTRSLIEYYGDEGRPGRVNLAPGRVLIAMDPLGEEDVCLDVNPLGLGSVEFTRGETVSRLLSSDFGKLLYRTAFLKYRMAKLPHRAYYATAQPEPVLRRLRFSALKKGMKELPFSDAVVCCGEMRSLTMSLT